MADQISFGEERAWDRLLNLDPADVCKRAGALYDGDTASYLLQSLGFDFSISPLKREIKNVSEKGEILVKRLSYFFNPSVLSYLLNAKEIPLSGRLIKPEISGVVSFSSKVHICFLTIKLLTNTGMTKRGSLQKEKN